MIKLENIIKKQYNKTTGELEVEETEEFVCDVCRHLVSQDDIYCWFCGTGLSKQINLEHYVLNEKLTNEQFTQVHGKCGIDIRNFINSLPKENIARRGLDN